MSIASRWASYRNKSLSEMTRGEAIFDNVLTWLVIALSVGTVIGLFSIGMWLGQKSDEEDCRKVGGHVAYSLEGKKVCADNTGKELYLP